MAGQAFSDALLLTHAPPSPMPICLTELKKISLCIMRSLPEEKLMFIFVPTLFSRAFSAH